MASELKKFDAKIKALRLELINESVVKKNLLKILRSVYTQKLIVPDWKSESFMESLGSDVRTLAFRLTLLNRFMQFTYSKTEDLGDIPNVLRLWFVKKVQPLIAECLSEIETAINAGETRQPNGRVEKLQIVEDILQEKSLSDNRNIEVDIVNAFIAIDKVLKTQSVPSSRKRYAGTSLAFAREVFEREYKRIEEECTK